MCTKKQLYTLSCVLTLFQEFSTRSNLKEICHFIQCNGALHFGDLSIIASHMCRHQCCGCLLMPNLIDFLQFNFYYTLFKAW